MPYCRNSMAYDHDFWYTIVKLWYLQIFLLLFFLNFEFWTVKEVKGQKIAKNKKLDYIYHTSYLRNSIAYDQDFLHTCVKWWYLQVFFPFFQNFDFQVVRGGRGGGGGAGGCKRVKNGPKLQKIPFIALHISGTIHHVTVIYGTHL